MLLVKDHEIARDIVQEAFLRLWQSPRTPRDSVGFKNWLYRTVTNLARDHHRRSLRWGRLMRRLPTVAADPEQEAESRWSNDSVRSAIRRLPPREREALYLRYFQDASFDEVAMIVGKSSGATRVLVHRALRKLRDQLGPLQEEADHHEPR